MANEYVTVAQLKETLSLTGETFADADIAAALSSASRAIDNECGRRFWLDPAATSTRYYSPTSTVAFEIDDLTVLSSLKVDDAIDGTFTATWVQDTNFTFEPMNAPADGWPWTRVAIRSQAPMYLPTTYSRTVRITGQFGWPAVPAPIIQATTIQASRFLKRAREAPFGAVGFGMDGAVVRVPKVDGDVAGLVAPYKRGSLFV